MNLVKDCYFTILVLHSLCGLVHNQKIEVDYLVFVTIIGYLVSSVTQYFAMVLEQKKLIQEIKEI